MRAWRPACAIATFLVASAVGGCGSTSADPLEAEAHSEIRQNIPLGASVTTGVEPHRETARQVIWVIERAALAVHNAVDTTAQECPSEGCDQAIVTDEVRVQSFATPESAQRYASAHRLDHVGTIVVSFAPPVSAADRSRYWSEIRRLAG